MKTIKIKIDYPDEYTINGEYTAKGTTNLLWFVGVPLEISVRDKIYKFGGASTSGEYYLPLKSLF
jgi:hypothetical protein